MKRIFICVVTLVLATVMCAQNSVITYTASNKLSEVEFWQSGGIRATVFGAKIKSHEFANGEGIITFDGAVSSVGNGAFNGCSELISIKLPDGIQSLGESAFDGCSQLTSIKLPVGIQSLGVRAFKDCSQLASIYIPGSVNSIGKLLFENCSSLTEIVLPNGANVAPGVFRGCHNLSSVTLPGDATTIGEFAFDECYSLTSIIIPEAVETLEDGVFRYCQNMKFVVFEGTTPPNVTTDGDIFYDCGTNVKGGTIVIVPEETAGGYKEALKNTSLKLDNIYTLSGFTNHILAEIDAEVEKTPSLTDEEKSIINECKEKIKNAQDLKDKITELEKANAIIQLHQAKDALVELIDKVITYYSVKDEEKVQLQTYRSKILNAEDMAGLEELKKQVMIILTPYTNCIYYTSTDNQIVEIYNYAVFGANYVSNTYINGQGVIKFDGPVTCLGGEPFYYEDEDPRLKSITIPLSVTTIEAGTFDCCENLESIVVAEGNSSYDSRDNCDAIIHTETNTLVRGCKNTVIPNTVTSIEESAFYLCRGLIKMNIPYGVKSIGKYAFYECKDLEEITIPNSMESIGRSAFESCTSLTEITIPKSVISLGDEVLQECKNLESVVIEEGNPSYDSRDNCNAIIQTETNTLIHGCKNTVIPNSVINIGEYAFSYCSSLKEIAIPNSVKSIGEGAFWGCSSLTEVTIPNSVTNIELCAFYDCDGLTEIVIPNSVKSIGSEAFSACNNLESAVFKSLPLIIEYNAFSECYKLKNVIIDLTDSEKPYIGTSLENYPSGGFTEAHYHRTLANDGKTWGTITLPFVPANTEGLKFYTLKEVTNDKVVLTEVTNIEAGVPYLFRNMGESADFTLTAADPSAIAVNPVWQEEVGGMKLVGAFQKTVLEGDPNAYGLYTADNTFRPTTGKLTINPFRAYLYSTTTSAAKAIVVDEDTPTGIEDLSSPILTKGEGINVQGIHVGTNYKGIVIKNGKKYLNK